MKQLGVPLYTGQFDQGFINAVRRNDSNAITDYLGGESFRCDGGLFGPQKEESEQAEHFAAGLIHTAVEDSPADCHVEVIATLVGAGVPLSTDNVTVLQKKGCHESAALILGKLDQSEKAQVVQNFMESIAGFSNMSALEKVIDTVQSYETMAKESCAKFGAPDPVCRTQSKVTAEKHRLLSHKDHLNTSTEGKCWQGDFAACCKQGDKSACRTVSLEKHCKAGDAKSCSTLSLQRSCSGTERKACEAELVKVGITRVSNWVETEADSAYSWMLNQLVGGYAVYFDPNLKYDAYLIAIKQSTIKRNLQLNMSLESSVGCLRFVSEGTMKNLQGFPMKVRFYDEVSCPY